MTFTNSRHLYSTKQPLEVSRKVPIKAPFVVDLKDTSETNIYRMSIFKAKQWWSNESLQNTESNEGIQNDSCIKVDKFNSHSDSDSVVVGQGSLLQIYKPSREMAAHPLIEIHVNSPILQVETGKFIVGAEDRQILLLHPQSYVIYHLLRKEGHTDVGEQNILEVILKHSFTRRAHCVTCGPFGNIKTRDLICIQGLDGSLSFFDQDTFVFMYIFEDIIIPGPVNYIPSSDAFVVSKSTWELEIYSYHQLREFSELKAIQSKKNIPQWVYQAGEEISSIQIIQTSSNFSSVVALGERHLYCFQDNGLMKYMIKFDFMPICFYSYLIGWYYEPTARLLIMVASDDSKLYVYEGTTLLWSCALLQPAISIARCFLKHLPGGIVALSPTGVVTVNYLGTEPDLNSNAAPMISDTNTAEEIQTEHEQVEETLKKILDGDEGDIQYGTVEQMIEIKANVGKPVQNLFEQFTSNSNYETIHLLMCPVVSTMKCNDPQQIQSVQITYSCTSPFAFSEQTICLDNLNGTEIIETQIFLTSKVDIPDAKVKILYTLIDTTGKICVLTREVELPISLYCNPVPIVEENKLKLKIELNKPSISFHEIFTDFTKEDLFKHGNLDVVSLGYRTTERTVTIRAESEGYSIEVNDAADFAAVLGYFIIKLEDYFARMNVRDFHFNLIYDEELMKQVIYRFLKSIETHANERTHLKTLEEELNVLQRQFTVVQKRLLVQYGSLPPGDCDPLEFLMKDTQKRLVKSVEAIIISRELISSASCTLTAIGHLIMYVLKINTAKEDFKVNLIEEMMSLNSLNEHYQEWEESVTQGLYYILNNVFYKTDKDKKKLAPVTEQGVLAHVNLKRFLKQIRIVLDQMLSEGRYDVVDTDTENVREKKILRIEEFVEVI